MEYKQESHFDANETVFFSRQLEALKARTYDIKYPQFKAQQFIPVSTEAGEGAKSITYEQFDQNGISKFIADYADDLPNVEVSGKEFTSPVRQHGNSYQFSNQEIRAAAFANKPLKSAKAAASRRAYEQLVDDTAWFGDGSAKYRGLTGLVYNPSINIDPAPNGTWASATPDDIIEDICFAINNPRDVTNGVEFVDTVLMSIANMTIIKCTPRSSTSDTTILEFVQRTNPGVRFDELAKLKALDPAPSGGAAPTEVLLAFRSDPGNLTLEIPMPYTQHPAQMRNLAQVIPTEASHGGVIIYYPLSVQIVEGL